MRRGEFVRDAEALGAVGETGPAPDAGVGATVEPRVKRSGFPPVLVVAGITLEAQDLGDGNLLRAIRLAQGT